MIELLKKRYHGYTISEYKKIPIECCPEYLSGVYFCHFAICVVMGCSPALNQMINAIDILNWFKKILRNESSMGPYVQTTQ